MTAGKTGAFQWKANTAGMTLELSWQEMYDQAENCSQVSVSLGGCSSAWYGVTYWLDGTVCIDGKTVIQFRGGSGTHYLRNAALNTHASVVASPGYPACPWVSQPIPHLSDGSKTAELTVSIRGITSDGKYGSGWKVEQTVPLELTPLARASSVGATDAFIGSTSVVAVSKKLENSAHSIFCRFGQLEGYITEDGGWSDTPEVFTATNIPFAVPESFYSQIPNSPSGQCSLICTTFVDGQAMDQTHTAQFTLTADPARCAPLLQPSVRDICQTSLALTGSHNQLVRYISMAQCDPGAAARMHAQLVDVTVNGILAMEPVTLEQVETGMFVFRATDSRGYTTTAVVELPMIAYIRPSCVCQIQRLDPVSSEVLLQLRGDCFTGNLGGQENVLQVQCALPDGRVETIPVIAADGRYSATVVLTQLDYRVAHTLQITAADLLSQLQMSVSVGKGTPVFDWGEEDVVFHVPIYAPNLDQILKRLDALEGNTQEVAQ